MGIRRRAPFARFNTKQRPFFVILDFLAPTRPRARLLPRRVSARAKNRIKKQSQTPLGHKTTHRHNLSSGGACLALCGTAALRVVMSPRVAWWCVRGHRGSRRACATKPRLCARRASTLPYANLVCDADTAVTAATAARRRRENGRLRRLTPRARRRRRARQAAGQSPARRLGRPPRRRDANARRRRRRRRLRRRRRRHAEDHNRPRGGTAQQHSAQRAPQPTPQRARRHPRTRQATPAELFRRDGELRRGTAPLNRFSPQSTAAVRVTHQRNCRAERTHRARGARVRREQAKPPGGGSGAAAIALWRGDAVPPAALRARRRGRRGRMPPRRGADTARVGDDDDDGPRAPPPPQSPIPACAMCHVMSLSQPRTPTYLFQRASCAPWKMGARDGCAA